MIDRTIDKFEWRRFRAFFSLYMSNNRKKLLGAFGVITGILVLIAILFGRNCRDAGFNPADEKIMLTMIFYGVFNLYVMIAGSLTFSSLKNKSGRLSALMLPAAKSEKFFVLTLIYTLLADLGFLIACIVADLCHSLVTGIPPCFALLDQIFNMEGIEVEIAKATIIMLLIPLVNQSIYTLGSALWPRLSFLITFCIIFVFQIILLTVLPVDYAILTIDNGMSFEAYTAVMSAIIVTLYLLAWLRFSRMQLAQRFLSN